MHDDVPTQAAAIPFRRQPGAVDVCLIRKRTSDIWGIPKGLIDPGDTAEQTALNEAWEEAGLTGRLRGDSIGTYTYEKWSTTFNVAVFLMEFLMEVFEQSQDWQEARTRERRWTSFGEAEGLLARHPVHALLDRARSILAGVP